MPLWAGEDEQKTGADALAVVSKVFQALELGAFDAVEDRLRAVLLRKLRTLGWSPLLAERCAARLTPSLAQAERRLMGDVLLLERSDVSRTIGPLLSKLGPNASHIFNLLPRPALAEKLIGLGLSDAMAEAVAAACGPDAATKALSAEELEDLMFGEADIVALLTKCYKDLNDNRKVHKQLWQPMLRVHLARLGLTLDQKDNTVARLTWSKFGFVRESFAEVLTSRDRVAAWPKVLEALQMGADAMDGPCQGALREALPGSSSRRRRPLPRARLQLGFRARLPSACGA